MGGFYSSPSGTAPRMNTNSRNVEAAYNLNSAKAPRMNANSTNVEKANNSNSAKAPRINANNVNLERGNNISAKAPNANNRTRRNRIASPEASSYSQNLATAPEPSAPYNDNSASDPGSVNTNNMAGGKRRKHSKKSKKSRRSHRK